MCRNANHLVSNASLLRLQRHTDHHMRGHVPFYQLRNVEGAPRLPADYSTMMLVAWLPPLWFSIMNPRVCARLRSSPSVPCSVQFSIIFCPCCLSMLLSSPLHMIVCRRQASTDATPFVGRFWGSTCPASQ